MPVHVEKRGGKHRLVEPNGNIARTKGGRSRDGGGHESEEKARAQARAINASINQRKH